MSLIPIVDDDDNILEYKERNNLEATDIYRVSALWITNSQGEILLAQRHKSKKHHPLKWGPAVAGTVEKDETYEQNILRETEEEIGIVGIKPSIRLKILTKTGYHHFTQWFHITLDLPLASFKIQSDEVEALKWIHPEDLRGEFTNNPQNFVPSFEYILPVFL